MDIVNIPTVNVTVGGQNIGCFQGDLSYARDSRTELVHYDGNIFRNIYNIDDCYTECEWKSFIGLVSPAY